MYRLCRFLLGAGFAILAFALALLALRIFFLALLLLGLFAWRCGGGWQARPGSHGSARWADEEDLARAGMLGRHGLILGRIAFVPDLRIRRQSILALFQYPLERSEEACRLFLAVFRKPSQPSSLIRLPNYCHLLCTAGTGRGKGVGLVIPNLLSYRKGSLFVFDPKGELFLLTAGRRVELGHRVIRIDPFEVCGPGGDCFNPLSLVRRDDPLVLDEARALAEAFVVRTGEEKDPHWNDQAVAVLTALLAFTLVCMKDEERRLGSVREILTDPVLFEAAGNALRNSGGLLRRLGNQLLHLRDKELASVLSTTDRHTTFLDSPAVESTFGSDSFDPQELLQGRLTIYFILPATQLQAQSRLLRLVVSSFIRLIARRTEPRNEAPASASTASASTPADAVAEDDAVGEDASAPTPTANQAEVLMLLDEAGQLGYLESLEQGLTMLRGAGLRLWFFFQSMEQAKQAFKGKENLLFDNCDTQIFFGINAWETAERISSMLGERTITVEGYQSSFSHSHSTTNGQPTETWQQSGGYNYTALARRLLRPEEVLQLSESAMVLFTRGLPPLRCRRIPYYCDPAFAGDPGGLQQEEQEEENRLWMTAVGLCLVAVASLYCVVKMLFLDGP